MPHSAEPYWPNSIYWGAARAQAMHGMAARQAEVPPRTTLYRFIDLNRGWVEGAADGPWWFELAQVKALQAFALREDLALAECARRLASVRDEFETVNAIVWAKVGPRPLLVWKGLARTTADDAAPGTEGQDAAQAAMPPIVQIFIPGLGLPYRRFSAFMRIEGADRLNHQPAQ